MKKFNKFANDNTSVNHWLEAYEETFEKESDHLCEYLEEKYDEWYNPDSNAYGHVYSPKEILINTGEYLVEAYFDNLDEETYHQYKDTLDKLREDVNNYDAFVKFVCEKANLPFRTCYDIGKDFAEKEYVYYEHEAKTTTKRLCRIGSSFAELSEEACEQSYDEVMNMLNTTLPKIVDKLISQGSTYDVEDILEEARKDIGQVVINKYNKIDEIGVPSSAVHTFGQDFIDIYYDELTDLIEDYLDENGF